MATSNHPLLWTIVNHTTFAILELADLHGLALFDLEPTDEEVLRTTGPNRWTSCILEYLRNQGLTVSCPDVRDLMGSKLFGDVLLLPIDALGTGQSHSGSSPDGSPDALLRHQFTHSWRRD